MDRSQNHDQHASTWGEAIGKLLLFFLMVKWMHTLLFTPITAHPWIILDSANFLIHEGGHILFSIFGDFMGILGGSVMQIFIPLIFAIYFMQRMSWFSAFFCLFWLGDSITNVARYIMDASVQKLPLFGGEGMIHDWNWLLSQMNLLQYDIAIGIVVFYFGTFCIGIAMIMMIVDIYYSFRHIGLLQKTVEES